ETVFSLPHSHRHSHIGAVPLPFLTEPSLLSATSLPNTRPVRSISLDILLQSRAAALVTRNSPQEALPEGPRSLVVDARLLRVLEPLRPNDRQRCAPGGQRLG